MLKPSPDAAHFRDYEECREAIRQGSRTFFVASLLLPDAVRVPAYGFYAFCRHSDDCVDEGGGPQAVLRLRDRLERAYAGNPRPVAADRALSDLVRRFAIPHAVLDALLEGMSWDTRNRRYESLDDLTDYAVRVAGTVGVTMTLIMGVRSPQALARACDLGVAMQLTNIARDVGEDARNGRLYLPLSFLREAGIDPEAFMAEPMLTAPLQSAISRLLGEADALYRRARLGVAHLPLPCRPAILAAGLIYSEIGRELERIKLDPINRRARVPGLRKSQLLAKAVAMTPWLERDLTTSALPAAKLLLEAVANHPAPPEEIKFGTRTRGEFRLQLIRVLEIFERLQRAEQFGK
jgi:phytoene synthase